MTIRIDKQRSPIVPEEEDLPSLGILRVKLPSNLDCQKWAAELSKVTPQILAFEGDGEYFFTGIFVTILASPLNA